MITALYSIVSFFVSILIWIPAIFNPKIRKGIQGRLRTWSILKDNIQPSDKVIWMHVASLGEFEQGRPVLERLKDKYPAYKILLTFFSPSGYEIRKDYEHADVVCYLPLDLPWNAQRFLKYAHPDLTVFVKYELWPNYLNAISRHTGKAILISSVVNSDNKILNWAPLLFKKTMNAFDCILTQDQSTHDLLNNLNIDSKIIPSGDTRIDRTLAIAADAEDLQDIEAFCSEAPILIAGSTWPKDEKIIRECLERKCFDSWKLVIAPHDIAKSHIDAITAQFPSAIRHSDLVNLQETDRVLIIDNIGLLNRLYAYGKLAYIGGGFGAGIHNTLEPAAFGLPIIFGPKYDKFVEAKNLVATGGAFSIQSATEMVDIFNALDIPENYTSAQREVNQFMELNKGATDDVMDCIAELISK